MAQDPVNSLVTRLEIYSRYVALAKRAGFWDFDLEDLQQAQKMPSQFYCEAVQPSSYLLHDDLIQVRPEIVTFIGVHSLLVLTGYGTWLRQRNHERWLVAVDRLPDFPIQEPAPPYPARLLSRVRVQKAAWALAKKRLSLIVASRRPRRRCALSRPHHRPAAHRTRRGAEIEASPALLSDELNRIFQCRFRARDDRLM